MKNGYRDRVKRRLGINEDDDSFDSDIDDFTIESIDNLFPIVQVELAPEEFPLLPEEYKVDLSASDILSVRKVLLSNTEGVSESTDDFTMHGETLALYGTSSYARIVTVEGLGRYNIDNVPLEYNQVVINWIMSEFYSLLVGDKRKYTLYTQTSAARSVDNLRDLSDYYLDRGNQILADRATIRGQ